MVLLMVLSGCGRDFLQIEDSSIDINESVVEGSVPNGFQVDQSVSKPIGVQASAGTYSDKIRITWEPVYFGQDVVKYHIFRYQALDAGESSPVVSEALPVIITGIKPTSNLWIEDTLTAGIEEGGYYFYSVMAIIPSKEICSAHSYLTAGYMLSKPDYFTASFRTETEQINLDWDPVRGAQFYSIERAEEVVEGVVPSESQFKLISAEFISGDNWSDLSVFNNGSVESGKIYHYKIFSWASEDVKSSGAASTIGALRVVGTPNPVQLVNVSRGEVYKGVRIEWNASSDVTGYKLYRINQEQFDSGSLVGTVLDMNPDAFASAGVYYDLSSTIQDGDLFYYRIAAVNEFGEGQLSLFETAIEQDTSKGNVLAASDPSLAIIVQNASSGSPANSLLMEVCPGADSFMVFRLYPTAGDPDPSGGALIDSDWGLPLAEIKGETQYDDYFSNIASDFTPFNDVWYRVLPYSSSAVNSYSVDGENVTIELKTAVASWQAEIDNIIIRIPDWDGKIGVATYSSSVNNSVDVPSIVSFTPSQATVLSSVEVAAKLSSVNGLGVLYGVRMTRNCQYGEEEGVYVLSQPPSGNGGPDGTAVMEYSKEGVAPIVNSLVYQWEQLKSSFDLTGNGKWMDQMPDFDRSGNVIAGKTLVWNYKNWDREIWKHILRAKEVDLERFFKIQYQMEIINLYTDEVVDSTAVKEGWPLLSNFEFGSFARWMVDAHLLNTIWPVHIPRFSSNKTVDWLAFNSYNYTLAGQNMGQIKANLGSSGGGGSTNGEWYAEWADFQIKIGFEIDGVMDAVTNPGAKMVAINNVEVKSPLFDGKFSQSMAVRDFGIYWGIWNSGTPENPINAHGGYMKIDMNSPEDRPEVTLAPQVLYPFGYGGPNGGSNPIKYNWTVTGYDPLVDIDPVDPNPMNPEDGYNSSWFTRVNMPCRPNPCGGSSYIQNLSPGEPSQIVYTINPW